MRSARRAGFFCLDPARGERNRTLQRFEPSELPNITLGLFLTDSPGQRLER